jgi:hypothetical protein
VVFAGRRPAGVVLRQPVYLSEKPKLFTTLPAGCCSAALQAAHWRQAVDGSVRSADLVLRVIDRRVKLLGLDQIRTEDDRPQTLIVSAPDWDEEGYIRQLQAISDAPNQATRKATESDLAEERERQAVSLPSRGTVGC